ncbi:phage tail protein [Formicincola oecophyllae]|uniref:Phage tail protein n=1 Tax=Formicincola oecophyllae TaxID=2558361 RepID=A0A4Y6UBN1_9PROT|nr:phage tail sheath subtilisin-like domain-containing protein [Formicincola oecophyllae]QDH13811.1 phage tail protein [Formicincola oecophyllae]
MVDFAEIPGSWAVPGSYTEVIDVPNPNRVAGMPLRCVIVGATASKAAGTLYGNISAGQAALVYGPGSVMAQAVATFIQEQPTLQVDAVAAPLAGGATAASATITFTGTATAAAQGAVWIAGQRVTFSVSQGTTAVQASGALLAAIFASPLMQKTGVTAAQGQNGAVTLTAGDAGALGNDLDVRVSTARQDMTPGLVVTVTPFAGGAGTSDISTALQALGDSWYTDLILLANDPASIQLAVQEANRRGKAMVGQDMRVWVAVRATQGQALALAKQFDTAQELVLLPMQAPRASSWNVTAALAAQGAQSLNTDPARQLRGLPLSTQTGLGPDAADVFDMAARQVLLMNGCSTFRQASDGTITLERVVTTRTQDPVTSAPVAPWDVMLPAIAARVRFEWNAYVEGTYARAKLADDDSPLALADGVVTCRTLKGSWVAQCGIYQGNGWVDDVKEMAPQAVFTRDASDRNRVNASLPVRAMGSLMVLANQLQLQY